MLDCHKTDQGDWHMRTIFTAFLTFCVIVFSASSAMSAKIINDEQSGNNYKINEDIIITDKGRIKYDFLDVYSSIFMDNRGEIVADINVCDGCEVRVKNSGIINGTFMLAENSTLTQLIVNSADITKLSVNGRYDIWVRGGNNLSLNSILNIAGDVSKITFENTTLRLSGNTHMSDIGLNSAPIELVGINQLLIDDMDWYDGMRILSNVSGEGILDIRLTNSDVLYSASAEWVDDEVYLQMVRLTDYARILGPGIGDYVEYLHDVSPDMSLLYALDNAKTMNGIYNILNHSILFNPKIMMRPIIAFDTLERTRIKFHEKDDFGVSFAPIYVHGHDADIVAGRAELNATIISGMNLSFSAYGGNIIGTDSFDDEFEGSIYGANIAMDYLYDAIYVHALAGTTFARLETPGVYSDGRVRDTVNGVTRYADVDLGLRLVHKKTKAAIVPFIGLGGDSHEIAGDKSGFDISPRGGVMANVKLSDGPEISYDVAGRMSGRTDGTLDASIALNVLSIADDAGGYAEIGIVRDDFDTSYKISIGFHAMF